MRLTFPFGLNENHDGIPQEAYKGSYNFELALGHQDFEPRNPMDLSGTTSTGADIRGIMQLVKRDNTYTSLVQSGDEVYTFDGSSFTSVGACATSARLRGCTWSLGDYMIITDLDKKTELRQWDGSDFTTFGTNLVNPFAKYCVSWNNRIWLFNLTENGVDLSHVILASAWQDPTNLNTSIRAGDTTFADGDEAFYMTSPDLKPINGVALFKSTIIFSTVEGKLYKITGTDSTNYAITQFYGGSAVIGDESLANIGNDVTFMREGGVIESLIATETFGDVGADDLSKWIPDSINGLAGCRTVYDQSRQKVYYFTKNKCLVLFKNILPSGRSPWGLYRTEMSNKLNASSALYMKVPGESTWAVYWGDSSGNVYKMDSSNSDGDGGTEDIFSIRKTYYLDGRDVGINPRLQKVTGRLKYLRIKEVECVLTFDYGDDLHNASSVLTLKGAETGDTGKYYAQDIYYGDTNYYNTGFTFADRVSSKGFSPTGRGPGFFFTTEVNSKLKFRIKEIEIPAI